MKKQRELAVEEVSRLMNRINADEELADIGKFSAVENALWDAWESGFRAARERYAVTGSVRQRGSIQVAGIRCTNCQHGGSVLNRCPHCNSPSLVLKIDDSTAKSGAA